MCSSNLFLPLGAWLLVGVYLALLQHAVPFFCLFSPFLASLWLVFVSIYWFMVISRFFHSFWYAPFRVFKRLGINHPQPIISFLGNALTVLKMASIDCCFFSVCFNECLL